MIRRPPRSTLFPYTTLFRSARVVERPTTLDYLHTAFDDFVELHGDRAFADDPAVVGGIASIDRKSTRLNSSHANISYAVFCLKKKNASKSPSIINISRSDTS